jgi:rare lipoprotein A
MRKLLTTVLLALTLGAGSTLPASAYSGERDSRDWSEGPRYFYKEQAERPQRQRLARATYSDSYGDEEDVRPRRRSYDAGDRNYERRYSKRKHAARVGKKTRRHHVARRPAKTHQRKAVVQRERPARKTAVAVPKPAPATKPAVAEKTTPAPGWSKKSLSTDGRRAGQHGVASYYWQGQRVASGGWFNPNAMTAAHKTLPFGTKVRVTHLGNGRTVEVTINDRGPFIAGRIIDLSKAAAGVIGMTGQGIARVAVEVLGR